ncbi:MAG: T9SS type A sorting domain-containing protein [Flavobacterium sp.]
MKKKKLLNVLTTNKCLVGMLFILGCSCNSLQAQFQNNGVLHVGTNSFLYVTSGDVTFGAASATTTNRTTPYSVTDGKFVLGSASSFSTDGAASKFINGYADTRSTAETLLAIGAGSVYAPIKVTTVSATGVHAAYVSAAPLTAFAGGLDSSVSAVANTEYWFVKGVNAIVTLSWRAASGITSYPYADVTIVGYKNGKWEAIPSAIDATSEFGGTSSLSGAGSVTSSSAVALSTYDALAIGKKGVSCAPVFVGAGNAITFNGTSFSATPTENDFVTITGAGTPGSFVCNTLDMQAFTITLTSTDNVEVVNGVTGTGKIIMSSEASFVQRSSSASAPLIELTKTTRPMKRFDYVYWGSPISQDAFTQLNGAKAVGATLASAFDAKYKYVSGDITATGGWQALTATAPGNGFITRVKEQDPFTTASATAAINVKFDGTANNGTVTVPVSFVSGTPTSARNNNLLANPYPSAIDADKFLTENSSLVDGVIYLWKAQTVNDGAAQAYTVADYIAYTKAGTTADLSAGTGGVGDFTGKIASGQGFKVKAIGAGNALFTNCMRVVGSNSQFYRNNDFATNTTTTVDRFKVNLQTANGIANQVLVAYLPQTTLSYDTMYDAELFTVSPTKMYSILDNDTKKLAINARPTFDTADEVIVGFTKETAATTQMSFNVVEKEGVFASNATPIYLFDNQLNVYHDFATGPYSFYASSQEDNNRFKIVYQNALSTTDFTTVFAFTTLNQNTLKVTAKVAIEQVLVFDITGRLILDVAPETAATTLENPFYQAAGVYVVKVKLTNGQIVTSKLINKN